MAESKLKIALIISSTRRPRVGVPISKWAYAAITPTIPSTALLEIVDLADWPLPLSPSGEVIPPYNKTGSYGDPQVDAWSKKVAEFDGFLFVTPVYNWSVPAVLKVSIDHLFHEWTTKPMGVVSYGGRGGGKSADALQEIWKGLRGGEYVGGVELKIEGPGMVLAQTKGELDQVVMEAWEKNEKIAEVVAISTKLVGVLKGTKKG